MKFRKLFGLSIVLMMLSVFFIGTLSVKAAESYKIKATYGQTEARTMLEMINNFRTGADAWQWDQNGNKVDMTGNSPLVYDYNLEKIAMLRAMELIASYSHTRPDGSRCFTAYTGSYSYKAENIAIGTGSLPAEEVFTLWREDDEDYSGQGHRRNMLNRNSGAVGIAHVYYNGCHYWVQEFGNAANDTNEDLANDSETEVEIMVDPSSITEKNIGLHEENVSITVGENKDIPKAVIKFRTSGTWRYAPAVEAEIENTINWISSNQDIVRIDGKSMTGVEEGTAEITADYFGEKLTMTVTVDGKEADDPGIEKPDDPGIEKPDKTPVKIKLEKKKYIFKYSKNKRSFKLDVKVSSGKAVYKSNKAAVKVNKKGEVTIKGKFKGKAYITISAKGSNGDTVTKKVLITVKK